jgi:hypothetical protein
MEMTATSRAPLRRTVPLGLWRFLLVVAAYVIISAALAHGPSGKPFHHVGGRSYVSWIWK